jgi:hypothetical protein
MFPFVVSSFVILLVGYDSIPIFVEVLPVREIFTAGLGGVIFVVFCGGLAPRSLAVSIGASRSRSLG